MRIKVDPEIQAKLIEDMAGFEKDPYNWVLYSFPWGEDDLAGKAGPEPWQEEILKYISECLMSGVMDHESAVSTAIRMAVASGHGIGKSALVAWVILWSLSTFPDTRGVVTANTDTQLKTKTWAELTVWYNRFICRHWFTLTATSIFSAQKEHEKTWRFDAIPWSETRTEAFAGLHNRGKRIVLIFDEASAISDKIWEVAEGALTDENTQILWLAFGNPTRNSGRFRECFGRFRHRWWKKQIDSREVSLTNKTELQQWIDDYGLDSDFVKVRVRGIFPSATICQLISRELADRAASRKYNPREYHYAPRILGADVAWEGDDSSSLYFRQGNLLERIFRKHGIDNLQHAGLTNQAWNEKHADACFIDIGWGSGVVSILRGLGKDPIAVNFGGRSLGEEYADKRTEMWCLLKKWMEDGGQIPNDPQLIDDLTGPEIYFQPNGKKILESKKAMKKRGLPSPDDGDAAALTFAFPVTRRPEAVEAGVAVEENMVQTEYNVLD